MTKKEAIALWCCNVFALIWLLMLMYGLAVYNGIWVSIYISTIAFTCSFIVNFILDDDDDYYVYRR